MDKRDYYRSAPLDYACSECKKRDIYVAALEAENAALKADGEVLDELIRLYLWRFELAEREKYVATARERIGCGNDVNEDGYKKSLRDYMNESDDLKRDLRTYGEQKKAMWQRAIALRKGKAEAIKVLEGGS